MMKKQAMRILTSMIFIVVLWQVFAIAQNNEFILPYPMDVGSYMFHHLTSETFYQAVAITSIRSILALIVGFLLAFFFAYSSFLKPLFKDFFYPILLCMRSIPNISYILIILILFSRSLSVFFVILFIVFPIVYTDLYYQLEEIKKKYEHVLMLYQESQIVLLKKIYLPLLQPTLLSLVNSGLSLAFKVGVMAEIIGGMQEGIGRQLNLCRLNFDMVGLFAWTGWMILLLLLVDGIVYLLVKHK